MPIVVILEIAGIALQAAAAVARATQK